MYDVAAFWLGGVNTVLFFAIVIVGMISVQRGMAQLRRYREQATDVRKVGNILSELKTVTDWFQLGTNLGLEPYELKQIERDYQGNERRKQEMLDLWLRRIPNTGWKDVVSALQQMEENTVAEKIHQKYIGGESKL